jgi:hypothetical protein
MKQTTETSEQIAAQQQRDWAATSRRLGCVFCKHAIAHHNFPNLTQCDGAATEKSHNPAKPLYPCQQYEAR